VKTEQHTITVNEKYSISSNWHIPEKYDVVLIIAHGAGHGMNSAFISYLQQNIAAQDILTVKFNFPYIEQGRKAPDRAPLLLQTWQAVLDAVLTKTQLAADKIFISGKSMGGRIASMLAAQPSTFGGLILYGYPLHAPGKTDKPRYEHLSDISCPMLFFQGTRDSLCKLEILQSFIKQLNPEPDLHIIVGGDHSFKVLKRLNRTESSVWDEIVNATCSWLKK
jgi:predicted alpha/beta-hydrolase family hydrolase